MWKLMFLPCHFIYEFIWFMNSYMKSESKHGYQGSSLLPEGYHNSKFELTLET